MSDVGEVERRTDLVKARSIEIGTTLGGVVIATVDDLERIALRLARGMVAVPAHCRDQPGVVYALCMQALEWHMPIMSVINNSYVPRGGDRIGFQSQILHAVVEKNAPIKNRLRYEIVGEGDDRRCKVWATFKGEDKPHEYISETLKKMHPGHVTKDGNKYVKGSPLWDSNPEVQLFYSASRQWARLFCPDVLLGAYTPEELGEPIDVSSKVTDLAQRLKDKKAEHATARGFDVGAVAAQAGSIIEGDTNPGVMKEADHEDAKGRDVEGGGDGGRDGADHAGDAPHQSGSDAGAVGAAGSLDVPAVEGSAPAQADIFPPDRAEGKVGKRGKGKQR